MDRPLDRRRVDPNGSPQPRRATRHRCGCALGSRSITLAGVESAGRSKNSSRTRVAMTTEDSEVDSLPILKGAHGQRSAHPNCRAFGHLSQIFRQGAFRLVHAVSESPLPCDLDDFELNRHSARRAGYITHAASPPMNEPHAKPRSKSRDQWPTRRHDLQYTTSIIVDFPVRDQEAPDFVGTVIARPAYIKGNRRMVIEPSPSVV